jgi:hypothetical protein
LAVPHLVKLRSGRKAVILGEMEVGKKPLMGAYFNELDEWIPLSWTKQGNYDPEDKGEWSFDIVNWNA